MISKETILVTGGAGMIGSRLTEMLCDANNHVIVVDNLERGRREWVDKRAEFIHADLADYKSLSLPKLSRIFHLAARIGGVARMLTWQYESYYNEVINHAAFELAFKNKCPIQYTSTACAYNISDQVDSVEARKKYLKEEDAFKNGINAESVYGYSKALGEIVARRLYIEFGIPVSVCRFFNAYGPREAGDIASNHVIPALIKKVLDGMDPVEVWGSGRQERSFIYTDDACRALMTISENIYDGTPINFGEPSRISIAELARKIWHIHYGENVAPRLYFDTSKPEGVHTRAPDISRAMALGWEPQVSLDEGLVKTYDWYRSEVAAGVL